MKKEHTCPGAGMASGQDSMESLIPYLHIFKESVWQTLLLAKLSHLTGLLLFPLRIMCSDSPGKKVPKVLLQLDIGWLADIYYMVGLPFAEEKGGGVHGGGETGRKKGREGKLWPGWKKINKLVIYIKNNMWRNMF